jgi:hypothetical protein
LFGIVDLLAAGTALGHAKEWEGLVEYYETNKNANEMGQVRLFI